MPTVCEDKTQIWSSGKGFFSAITFLKTDKKTEHLLVSCVTLLFYQRKILLLQNFLKNLNPAIFEIETIGRPTDLDKNGIESIRLVLLEFY